MHYLGLTFSILPEQLGTTPWLDKSRSRWGSECRYEFCRGGVQNVPWG